MHTTALTLLWYVALWCGASVLLALAWWGLTAWTRWREKAEVLVLSKRELYDPRNPGDGCGD